MTSSRIPSQTYPSLEDLRFSGKIDFCTVITPHKLNLPPLDGTPKWSRKLHWTRLTIHDPTPADISRLIGSLGPLRLAEVEVSVDVTCGPMVPVQDHDGVLQRVMVGASSEAPTSRPSRHARCSSLPVTT